MNHDLREDGGLIIVPGEDGIATLVGSMPGHPFIDLQASIFSLNRQNITDLQKGSKIVSSF